MARKTVDVSKMVDTVNEVLAQSECTPDMRQGMMNLLENVLHETGNYKGFRYLAINEVPKGEKPGINRDEYGEVSKDYEARFANTDNTRVQYG